MADMLASTQFERPALILASPLVRADQTARILHERFAPEAIFETNNALRPANDVTVPMSLIASYRDTHNVLMIVGHDPLFSLLSTALVSGTLVPAIEMGKSSVALFELTRFIVPSMRGILRAFLPSELVETR
jgi:phosphohistidine phosphatase SixA